MTYIKKQDAEKIFNKMYIKMNSMNYVGVLREGLQDINSLPSIDFEEMIKQEIKTRRSYSYTADQGGDRARTRISIEIDNLHELLNKLT